MSNQKFKDESKLTVEIQKKLEAKIVSTMLIHTQASEIPKFEYSEHKKEQHKLPKVQVSNSSGAKKTITLESIKKLHVVDSMENLAD